MQILDAAYIFPSTNDPRGFIEIPLKGQSPIAIGSGPVGAATTPDLIGLTLPLFNGLGLNHAPLTAAGVHRGTIAGVYGDTGIFYSTDPRTEFYSYQTPPAGLQPTLINNSGDTVGEFDALNVLGTNILGVTTLWDAYQLLGYGWKGGPAIDYPDQRGNSPWGLASAVAGPQSGYAWEFDYATYATTPGTRLQRVQPAIQIGPWQRIQYPGSQISQDQPGLVSSVLGYAGVDASGMGYALSPATPLERLNDGSGVNAIRFALGQIELGRPEWTAVKIKIVTPLAATCYKMYADAFGGDAGGTDNGKDHLWRYFDPTVVRLEPCVLLQKTASKPLVAPGETFYYTIVFANNGSFALPNITLTDTLPSGIAFLSAIPAPTSSSPPNYTWNLGTVPPNTIVVITNWVRATGVGTLLNTVTVKSGTTNLVTAEETVEVSTRAILQEGKSVISATSVAPGATVTYTISILNVGTGPNGVPLVVTDFLPPELAYSGFVSAQLNGATFTPAIITTNLQHPVFVVNQAIQPGTALYITFTALVSPSAPVGPYCNRVETSFEGKKLGPISEACITVAGGQIGDFVWRDWDGDGVQDAGEEGIAGVVVQLRYPGPNGTFGDGDDVVFNTTTDANGQYLFTGLQPGNYRVTVTPPADHLQTYDADGLGTPNQSTTTLALNEIKLTQDFGYRFNPASPNAAQIGDFVFADNNRDGMQDEGEPGIPNVTVWLYEDTNGNGIIDSGDLLIATTATFPAVIGGKLDLNGDGEITTDDDGSFLGYAIIDGRVDVDNSGSITTADDLANFGGYPVIDGLLDIDRDGTAGVADEDDLAAGSYLFSGLDPDRSYIVRVDTADADLGTFFAPNPASITTTNQVAVSAAALLPGELYAEADFGFFGLSPATLGDLVYLDVDRNGAYNAGDLPLANITVQLYQDEDGDGVADPGELFATTATDLNGNYLFTGLGPGKYIVKVLDSDPDLPANAFGTVAQFNVTLDQGQNFLDADFPYVRFLEKSVDKAVEAADGILTYTLNPYIPGNTLLSGVQVTDPTPAGTTYFGNDSPPAATEPTIGGAGNVVWNLGSTVAAVNGTGVTPGYTPTATNRPNLGLSQADQRAEVDDTYVNRNAASTWYGNGTDLVTRGADANNLKVALIKFELPTFDAGDVVDRAVLRLMVKTPKAGHTVTLRRLTTDWTEGTSAANGATWNDSDGTGGAGDWATSGAFGTSDYDSTVSYGSYSSPLATGQTLEFDVTTLVRAWRAGTFNNYGVALIDTGTAGDDLEFYSSEAATTAAILGPQLVIAYSRTGSGTFTVADTFNNAAYTNNTGSRAWAGAWVETGDGGSPSGGDIRIASSRLEIKDGNGSRSIYRSANLAGATAATLSFTLAQRDFDSTLDRVKLQASINGGATWTDLETFTQGSSTGARSYNLVSLLGSVTKDTRIRFIQAGRDGGGKKMQVDELQISFTTASAGTTSTRLSAGTALLTGTRNVTVTMTVFSDVSANVTPPATLTVATTGGASATWVSGPTPATGRADSEGGVFTYVYQVSAGAGIGSVTFSGAPTGPGGGFTFNTAQSQSVLTTAPLTFQVKVDDPAPSPGPIVNVGAITANSGAINYNSPPAYTATTASIGDRVWADLDGGGDQDTGEPGIPGVTVRVYLDADMNGIPDGAAVGTAVTDSAGLYRVFGLPAGNYLVQYDPSTAPANYYPTTPGTQTVYGLLTGQQYNDADFGLRPPVIGPSASSIGDTLWIDANQNGMVDAGETPLPNVEVRLYADVNNNGVVDFADALITTTSTDASGNYLFTGLGLGNYLVDVNEADPDFPPAGLALVTGGSPVTAPPANGVWAVTIAAPATAVTTADFGYNWTGQIGDYVWWDDNRNGSPDGGELPIAGAFVMLYVDANDNGILDVVAGDYQIAGMLTDANGYYLFNHLPPGRYLVDVYEDSFNPIEGERVTVTTTPEVRFKDLAAGEPYLGADFGYFIGARVQGNVFWDANHNGLLDYGETRLPGIPVTLTGTDMFGQPVTATVPTDANGHFVFIVPEGDYTVTYNLAEVLTYDPTLGDQTTATSYAFHAYPGEDGDRVSYDFGVDNTGEVGDTLFADVNGTPGQQPGEAGLAGVTVELWLDNDDDDTMSAGDTFLETQLTDANGNYRFVGLADGNYVVRVLTGTLPPGYQTTPSTEPANEVAVSGNSQAGATVSGGGSVLDRDWGYPLAVLSYPISGTIWHDLDGDGQLDGGEPLLPGVTVTISVDADGPGGNPPILYTVQTDGSGNYTLQGVPVGATVVITVNTGTLPNAGFVQTGDPDQPGVTCTTCDSTTTFTMPNGPKTEQDFGYQEQLGSLSGTVARGNGNGIYDPGIDIPLAGATVTLTYAGPDGILGTGDDVVFTSVTTGPSGAYSFTGLLPGLYSITEQNPPGYVSLADRDGGNPDNIIVTLGVGQNLAGQDFEDTLPDPVIGDYVWLDENGDGVQDAGEAGIPNVFLRLFDLSSGSPVEVAWTVTDANGGYLFKQLTPGTLYRVEVDPSSLPAGLRANQTYDPDGTKDHRTEVTTPIVGEGVFTADFGYNWAPTTAVSGNTGLGAIGDRVWIDADGDGRQGLGEAGLGGVTVQLWYDSDSDGDIDAPLASTSTAADGSYFFDDLPAGIYEVRVTAGTTGYTQTGDPDGTFDDKTTVPILLAPGDVYVNADFGYRPDGNTTEANNSVSGVVFMDVDADGAKAAPDTVVPGVTVALIREVPVSGVYDGVWDPDGADNVLGTADDEQVIATTITGADGSYAFTGLPDGQYLVWVNDTRNILTDLKITADPDNSVPLNNLAVVDLDKDSLSDPPVAVGDQDFGYTPVAHFPGAGLIGDRVWLDLDGAGDQDSGEPGLEGVRVELYDAGNVLRGVTYTDENGNYWFGGLSPTATYTVKVITSTLPNGGTGLVNSGDPDGGGNSQSVVDLSLSTGGINLAQDFGYVASNPNTIAGTIWYDWDANGVLDDFLPPDYLLYVPFDGVTVVLRDSAGNIVASTTTSGGFYEFTGLPDGTYTVDVTDDFNVLNGLWHSLGDQSVDEDYNSKADPYTVSVSGGDYVETVDFGYYDGLPAALGNWVWSDYNNNGIQDGGEPGLPNLTVTLTVTYSSGATVTLTTQTDANGYYSFANLLLDENYTGANPGSPTFELMVQPPTGYTPSPENQGGDEEKDSEDATGEPAFPLKGTVNNSYDFGLHDFQAPVITCPPAITGVQCLSGVPDPYADLETFRTAGGTATDNSTDHLVLTHISDSPSGSCPTAITRTYQVADLSGNSATCTQSITVNDTTKPVITLPATPLSLECYNEAAVTTWANTATALDNCDGTVVVTPSWTPPANNCDQTVTVTFTATDACNNTATASATFTVDDNTPPAITVPPATLTMQCYDAAAVTAWAATASATDNCDGARTVTPNWTAPANNCDQTVTVTFTATDACGNTGTASKSFTVNDTTPPAITCPAHTTVECGVNPLPALTGTATATDTCDDHRTPTYTDVTLAPAANVTLVRWDFPNDPDDAIADGGIPLNAAKTITTVGGTGPVTYDTDGATTQSARAEGWNAGNGTKAWQIEFVTSGYGNLRLSSKQRGSATGPRDFKAQYSLNGTTWTDLVNVPAVANNFTAGVLANVALPATLDNQPSVFIRWIMTSDTRVDGGGSWLRRRGQH